MSVVLVDLVPKLETIISNVFWQIKKETKVITMGVTVDRSGDSMTENPTRDHVRHTLMLVNPICRYTDEPIWRGTGHGQKHGRKTGKRHDGRN
jgi:hypothetical protein